MRLQILEASKKRVHKDTVTAVTWNGNNQVYACSDDKTISTWKDTGEILKERLAKTDQYITTIECTPSIGGHRGDSYAIGTTSGALRLMEGTGRIVKTVNAHKGALITLKWSYDANTIASGGEDGSVKIWSKNGALRTTITKMKAPIYCICWSPDNDNLLWACGKQLVKKSSTEAGAKQTEWSAKCGNIMSCDWNSVNNLIVVCGENCTYGVWDEHARQLYQSTPGTTVLTSISWSPNGQLFAVGSFNSLRLCDRTGWSHYREEVDSGSLYHIRWSEDGTQVACAGGNGLVVFGQLIQQRIEWNCIEAVLVKPDMIQVSDVETGTTEELEFPYRVVKMSLEDGFLIAATSAQCYVYEIGHYQTPHIFELRATVRLIAQSDSYFLMCNNIRGVEVYSYEGRLETNPSFPGLQSDRLDYRGVTITSDMVGILNNSTKKEIRIFDMQGRQIGKPIKHFQEIMEIDICPYAVNERTVSFIDINRDLWVCGIEDEYRNAFKLRNMVDSAEWSDSSECLIALSDSKLVMWYYPRVVFVDRELLPQTILELDAPEFKKMPRLMNFSGPRITCRRMDGSKITRHISPYPPMLYGFVKKKQWEVAIRLCRFVNSKPMWAALAGLAIAERQLDAAEIALATIGELDKVQYICMIKEIPSSEGRNAELALYRGAPDEAEEILLQTKPPLIYRAVDLNIRLFRWERALNLALEKKDYIDLVLIQREQHLELRKQKETLENFLKWQGKVPIDKVAIDAKIKQELDDEKTRAVANI